MRPAPARAGRIVQVVAAAADGITVKSAGPGRGRRRALTGVALVVLVLLAGGLATTAAAVLEDRSQRRLATKLMDHHVDRLADRTIDEVGHYRDALVDLAAGITAQEFLSAGDFEALTATLNRRRLPGAEGVSFVVPASDPQTAGVQAYWRARGATGLTLYRSGTTTEHKYVVFTRTFTALPLPPGRDLTRTPPVDSTLQRARATGTFAAGEGYLLHRDRMLPAAQRQRSLMLAAPVFGQPGTEQAYRTIGWVAMGVRDGEFLQGMLEDLAGGAVQVRLTDAAGGTAAEVTGGIPMTDPGLVRQRAIRMGQQDWTLTVRPTTALLSDGDRRLIRLTVATGSAVTLLLAALVGVLATARNRALDRVDQATAALRKDIERRQAVEQELAELAFHDQLTGLANRILFYERVEQALHGGTAGERSFAVFFIDLDGFKTVNDERGHGAGDTVLRAVADRLRACVRDGDTVSRFGGDEFAVLVEGLADPAEVHVSAARIVAAVREPVPVDGYRATVTASVGIALNRPGDTADDILREADVAMYTAKTTGKCRHVLAGV
jgi:diguanylate cyclase (GGDEF)-like protein